MEVPAVTVHDRSRLGALPVEYSSFIDRRTGLAAGRAALGRTRLLTVVGPGGVGKTRFAIRLAQNVHAMFPGGTWYIDLTRVSAGGSVADEFAHTLGLSGMISDDFDELIRFFGSRTCLVVLDNCEHVVEQCARMVPKVLEGCPQLTVIATSRELLRIEPEWPFLVEPFETFTEEAKAAPATELFLDRCATSLPEPTQEERALIAEICRRLDGLPLAIELAARRIEALRPAQILDRLTDPFPILTRGARDAPERQQTLRAALQWSYELCTPAERFMWRRMAVFVGGCDLDAAQRVGGTGLDGRQAVDVLQSLLDKSIIVRRQSSGVVYYGMLDTVRAFGLDIQGPDEVATARGLHRDWYIDRLAELEADWFGPNQAYWLAYTRRELPNIRAALEFCIATGDVDGGARLVIEARRVVWRMNGRNFEAYHWFGRVLAIGTPPTPAVVQAVCLYGTMNLIFGDRAEGERWLALGRELLEQVDDQLTHDMAGDYFATCATLGHPEQAVVALAAALATHGGRDRIPARHYVEVTLVRFHDLLGHVEIAERMRKSLIQRGIEAGESYESGLMLLEAGMAATDHGDAERATMLLRQSLSLSQNLESPEAVARCEEGLAWVAADGFDYHRAAILLGMTETTGDPTGALYSWNPRVRPPRNELEDRVRQSLGRRAFDSAIATGRAMTMGEGIAYAMGTTLARATHAQAARAGLLTDRESQVASLVGQGMSDRQIAERLVISRRTAEGHVANSLMKLGFTSRAQLAAWVGHGSDSE
ncbi:ATP-binding protein [Leifsonia sp. McL0607]|uniref:ATP-binding protein n=1 Tax=Leifsonia sp. McL0607 TaxID=3415672 RepID=UPI003CF04156